MATKYSDEILDFYFDLIKGGMPQDIELVKRTPDWVNLDKREIIFILHHKICREEGLIYDDGVGWRLTDKGKKFNGFKRRTLLNKGVKFILIVAAIVAIIAYIYPRS